MTPTAELSSIARLAQSCTWQDSIVLCEDHSAFRQPSSRLRTTIEAIVFLVIKPLETALSTLMRRPIELKNRSIQQYQLNTTLSELKNIFGKERIERALGMSKLSASELKRTGHLLSKRNFALLYHALAMITKEDVEELLEELHGTAPLVRGISGEKLLLLRQQFSTVSTLSCCSPDHIATLSDVLLPFARPEDQFWTNPEKRMLYMLPPSSAFRTAEVVAWTCHLLRAQSFPLKDWEVLFAKRLAQPLLPNHLLIRHPTGGFLCLSHGIDGAGVSKRFFRSLHPEQTLPHVIYRGTRLPTSGTHFNETVRSLSDDLRSELGSLGPIKTYQATKELLEDPRQGFVNSDNQKVVFVTQSIGGAHGMRDAVLFHHKLARLTTNASPGIDKPTADLFRRVMAEANHDPIVITHIIERGDIVEKAGDEALGANCRHVSLTFRLIGPALHSSGPEQQDWSVNNRLSTFFFSGVRQLFSNIATLFHAHTRATVVDKYVEQIISTDDPATKDLALAYAQHTPPAFDPSWEALRRRFFCPASSPDFAAFARQELHVD